jgi:hypothetical protein
LLSTIYVIANASLQLYFGLKEVNQSLKVVDQVHQYVPADLPSLKSDKIEFHYLEGRVFLYFHRFGDADEAFEKAFIQCLPSHFQNRKMILKCWIVARIVRGRVPSAHLLEKYQLGHFRSLVASFSKGDLKSYQEELFIQRQYLLKNGFFTIMQHRVMLVLYRNAIYRMFFFNN